MNVLKYLSKDTVEYWGVIIGKQFKETLIPDHRHPKLLN